MRIAFGAGAVAAVSALTIGMVKPDFSGAAGNEAGSTISEESAIEAPASERVRVRRVTNYVVLKPGEKAPRGATVISAEELLGVSDPVRGSRPDGSRTDGSATGGSTTDARRDPQPKPDRQAAAPQPDRQPAQETQRQPEPQPDPPRVTTRQSGS